MPGILNPFWTVSYGFEDYDEFAEAVTPYFETMTPIDPLGIVLEANIRLAAANPSSAPGLAAAAYLTTSSYDGQPSRPFMQTVADAVNAAFGQSSGLEPPMVSLLIPDCFQVNIDATSGGQVVTNVIGVKNPTGTAAGAAAAVRAAWKTTSGPLTYLPAQYTLVRFKAVDIGDPNGDIVEVADTTAGGVGSVALSTNAACALVKWNGGTRSRSSRGRLYYGPLSENAINSDGRTITTAALTQFNTAFNNFRSSLTTAGYPLVVLSRQEQASYDVSTSAVETVIATQRRRIRG